MSSCRSCGSTIYHDEHGCFMCTENTQWGLDEGDTDAEGYAPDEEQLGYVRQPWEPLVGGASESRVYPVEAY